MQVFFVSPTISHYLMDISRTIGLAHTSVKKNLDILVKSGQIIESIEKKGARRFPIYRANMDIGFRQQKMLYNLSAIIDSGLVKRLEDALSPKSIVLFGSFRRGEDTEESDIDIFVECRKEGIDLRSFERKLGRKIELHFNENFRKIPEELRNNIINGIVLSGFLVGY